MKVKFKGKKVIIEMTTKQLESLDAVFDSFTDQIDETSKAYGDCVRNINKLQLACAKAMRYETEN